MTSLRCENDPVRAASTTHHRRPGAVAAGTAFVIHPHTQVAEDEIGTEAVRAAVELFLTRDAGRLSPVDAQLLAEAVQIARTEANGGEAYDGEGSPRGDA